MEKNIIDSAIYKFSEALSEKFGKSVAEFYILHKWGDLIEDRLVEVEEHILVLDNVTGEPYARITKFWDVEFLES